MIGTTIGKYRVVSRLGRGGMGTVYRAVDETLDREVAIKVLNSEVADARLMARFRAEATTLARMNFPEIATIYEIVKTDTEFLMVMELVRGETLDQVLVRCGPLDPDRAAYLVVHILNGLAHAHRAGIVHRDLKPANVMVTESGSVKIMDFGIARVLGAEHLTTDGTMMGTPAYMPPEQVMGKEVDARADLYSAGVLFYRLLTGALPFQADTPIGMVQKQLWEPPTPVHTHRPELPEWCETILTRALAKAAADRFQTADDFRSALLSSIGHTTPSVMDSSAFLIKALLPGAPTPPGGLTPAEFAMAPTVTMQPTPAHQSAQAPSPIALPPSESRPVPLPTDVQAVAMDDRPKPVTASAAPAAPRSQRRLVIAAAAVLAATVVIAAAIGLGRSGSSTGPSGAEPAAASTDPAAGTSGNAESVGLHPEATAAAPDATTAALDTATATSGATTAPTDATTAPAPGATATKPATTSGRAARTNPTPTPPPPAAPAPEPVPAAVEASAAPTPPPEPPPTPAALVLPPVIFSAQTVVVEAGKSRQRDTIVRLADGAVIVTGKDNAVVTTVPLEKVVGFTYSNSKQPMWNSPQGPAEITHLDGGAFGFLRGDQHWVSLRTEDMSLVMRVREQDSRRVINAIEERTGRKVERVSDR